MEALPLFTFTFSALSLGILAWIAFRIHRLEGELLEQMDHLLAQAVQVFEQRVQDGIKEAISGGVEMPEFNPVQSAIAAWIENQRGTIDVTPRNVKGRFTRGQDGEQIEP